MTYNLCIYYVLPWFKYFYGKSINLKAFLCYVYF